MCGRFAAGHLTQGQMQEIVEEFLGGEVAVDAQAPAPQGGYQIRPTNRISLVEQRGAGPRLTTASWQITPEGGRPLINARIENDSFWRAAWEGRRCMIPALGYFEWTAESGRKSPVYITVQSNAPALFFAGFLSADATGCVILTRPPSPQIAHIHTRMPVILSGSEMTPWLSGAVDVDTAQASLGTSWEGRFTHHPVAPLTRDAEGPEVIALYEPPQASFEF